MKKILCLLICLLPLTLLAQSRADKLPPKWLYGHVPADGDGIEFKIVRVPYTSYSDISATALDALVKKWGEESTVTKSVELKDIGTIERKNGRMVNGYQKQVSVLDILAEGQPVTLQCMLVDEWVHMSGSQREYCAVYELATLPGAQFKPCTVTTSYGAAPVFMSLFPGAGQFYKGDALKGALMMGGCVLGGAGIVLMESQRKAFVSMRAQTHDVNLIKKYAAAEKNLSIARNVTIGVTAALYLYNLIDAAVAPGARKIQLTPTGVSYSF